jgi:hypothetical protein
MNIMLLEITSVLYSVYINKDSLLECSDTIENENGWDDILMRESVELAQFVE